MQLVRLNARRAATVSAVLLTTLAVTGCQSGSSTNGEPGRVKSNPKEYFAESVFGVKASPRVTDSLQVRKGGGRDQVGKPYKVRGKWYYPKEQPGYVKNGKASWYGSSFHGRLTANGEVYDMNHLSAAHPTFPLPSYARVTNTKTGTTVMVRVNDRGPYAEDRVMDLSSKAAELLDIKQAGTGDVKVEYVGRAPLEGDDTPMLMASYRPGNGARAIDDGLASGVMIASNETPNVDSRLVMAAAMTSTSRDLPGVRPIGAIDRAIANTASSPTGMSIGAIINDPSNLGPRIPPLPSARMMASYAPQQARTPASAVLAALSTGATPERIEIGLVEDRALIEALRGIANDHGRLIVDTGVPGRPGSVSLTFEANPGENVDLLLSAIWQAGAGDAFVLRD